MKRILTSLLAIVALTAIADNPWRLSLENKEEQVVMKLDLYEETVIVPGMDLFGPMNGYLGGKGVFGVWMVTAFEIKSDKTATLRISNDLGSETQAVRLTQETDSTYWMELQGGVVVKRSVNHKLVKIPQKILLNLSTR